MQVTTDNFENKGVVINNDNMVYLQHLTLFGSICDSYISMRN